MPELLVPDPATQTRRERCRKKFLAFYPGGFDDDDYIDLERSDKWDAHNTWEDLLGRRRFADMLKQHAFTEIAARAVRIETRTTLLFNYEKMALRDALRGPQEARIFSEGLFEYVYGKGPMVERFENFTDILTALPRRQTHVLTWPLHTVFGFIGDPQKQLFLKPRVTLTAAEEYGYDFCYYARPSWGTYASLLGFADLIMREQQKLHPRDMIDVQGFISVLGSEDYA
mgnify:CR=1 FL=1